MHSRPNWVQPWVLIQFQSIAFLRNFDSAIRWNCCSVRAVNQLKKTHMKFSSAPKSYPKLFYNENLTGIMKISRFCLVIVMYTSEVLGWKLIQLSSVCGYILCCFAYLLFRYYPVLCVVFIKTHRRCCVLSAFNMNSLCRLALWRCGSMSAFPTWFNFRLSIYFCNWPVYQTESVRFNTSTNALSVAYFG